MSQLTQYKTTYNMNIELHPNSINHLDALEYAEAFGKYIGINSQWNWFDGDEQVIREQVTADIERMHDSMEGKEHIATYQLAALRGYESVLIFLDKQVRSSYMFGSPTITLDESRHPDSSINNNH